MINPMVLSTTTSSPEASAASGLLTFLPIRISIVLMWLILIRPQNKKRKQEEEMRQNARIGDEITTIGGIVGRVVGIKDDNQTLIIETGTDRAKMRIKRWAIGSVDTIHDDVPPQQKKKKGFFSRKKADAEEGTAKKEGKKDKQADIATFFKIYKYTQT